MKMLLSQRTIKTLKWIFLVFVSWRLSLVLITLVGIELFPLREGFLGGGTLNYLKNPLFWSWANFDGVHYLIIAKQGYYQYQQAFFPFYPFLVRFVALIFKNYLFSGLLVSHLSLLAAIVLFYRLVRLDFEDKIAKRSIIYLLIFPTAFFLGSVYTESLFLALVLATFFSARKGNWVLAGLFGALASATRLVGVFLFPALIVEWYLAKTRNKKQKTRTVLPIFIILSGLLVYMWYLQKTVGDPLYFIHVQPFFGAQRTGGKLILLYQVFWRYLKMLITVQKWTPTYFAVILETISGAMFLLLIVFAYLRRWYSYLVFMAFAYLAPTLTGTLSSMPRYVLVLFPGFIILAELEEKYRWLRILYPAIAVLFTIISVLFFTRGFWVA